MSFIEDLVDHQEMVHQIVPRYPAEPKCPVAHRTQSGAGERIAAGEEGDIVAEPDQLLGKVGDHPFGAAVQLGRDALDQWSNLCNFHISCSAE